MSNDIWKIFSLSLLNGSRASVSIGAPTGSFRHCQWNDHSRKGEADHAELAALSPGRRSDRCPSLVARPAQLKSPRLLKSSLRPFQTHPVRQETTTRPWSHAYAAKGD